MRNKKIEPKSFGAQRWIRLRGSPDDPESFDFAQWNGIAWEVTSYTSDGRKLTLCIPDYMVSETLPPEAVPEKLYKPLKAA